MSIAPEFPEPEAPPTAPAEPADLDVTSVETTAEAPQVEEAPPSPAPESEPASSSPTGADTPPTTVPTPDTAGVTQPPGQVLQDIDSVGDSREVAARANAGLDTMEGRPLTAAALGHIRELEQMAAALESWITWLRAKIGEVSKFA